MREPTTTRSTAREPDASAHDVAVRLGRRRFLQGVGVAAGAGALASALPAGAAQALDAGASQFVPLPEVKRVVDTRDPASYVYSQINPTLIRVPIAGSYGVPADATAVVATLTSQNLSTGNWITIMPAGTDYGTLIAQNRLVSTLNMTYFFEATANLVQVKLAGGAVDILALAPAAMILDVIGYYRPVTAAVREGRFVPLETARRAIDTRDSFGYVASNSTLAVDVTDFVPDEASSAVLNLTATECTGAGYFTVYPFTSTTVPNASSLNVNSPGTTRAAAVIVPVATQPNGRRYVNVYTLTAAKLIIDVTGYYTSTKSALSQVGLFVPADPVRILDTRDPGEIGRMWPGWIVERAVPSPANVAAGAVAVNLTGVNSRGPGFLTIGAARTSVPGTSNVNFIGAGLVVPNHAISPITSAGVWVYSSGGADVIIDYLGYYTGTPQIQRLGPPSNPPPPPAGPDWILRIPRIGLTSLVRSGDPNRVTDAGHSWHWTGTGYMGQEAHVASFAHRTEHGGPYRYLHLLTGGDEFTVTTGDAREYTYVVIRRDLTNSSTTNILNATRLVAGTTYSLIACSEPDFTPTSLSYRIIVTGALVRWRNV